MAQDLKARLAAHRALAGAPVTEHEWLIAHGTLRTYQPGDVVTAKGEKTENLIVLLTGHIVIRMDRGAGAHKIFEWKAGDVGGLVPYSRGASPPNDAVAEELTEVLTVHREVFPELIRECPAVTATLVHVMVDRARQFTSSGLRDEKLISLGKLAAGLAHELNNPASAVVRSAKRLTGSLAASEEAAREVGAARLSEVQLAAIDVVRGMCVAPGAGTMTAMARADREDALADWLARHGAAGECAGPLAETSVTVDALETLAGVVSGAALDASLRWFSAECVVRSLSSEIEMAGSRIHELVQAVKGFSYMDHAPTAEPVDIRRGISDTLTMLASKVRGKSIAVSLALPDDLPRAHAVGAELNQVWMNLIDNALDAVPEGGHVVVSAARELNCVTVRIVDDGPGIPADIQEKIFEPFFTTKGVGKGSGLGLDIVRRLLQRHEGSVAVESVPGRTEFQVRLPVER